MSSAGDLAGRDRDGPPVAVLWDQSLVWGLLCVDTLTRLGVPFELLGAREILAGRLDAYRLLLVPGGWAAHKVRVLGEDGGGRIGSFIDNGGTYLGFCGGAGMALSSPPGLYLAPVRRMPLSERLPSASGEVYISGALSHPAWDGIPPEIPVSIWWPSQFLPEPGPGIVCLATYSGPGAGFQVADLRVRDMDECDAGWEEVEKVYGINLNPVRIKGHPAIIEIARGSGRMVLSYAHLETPGDTWGNRLFLSLLHYLNGASKIAARNPEPAARGSKPKAAASGGIHYPASRISSAKWAADDLIAFGEANLLWNWRKPWLLNWRRGIRGLEYGSLHVLLACMENLERGPEFEPASTPPGWQEKTKKLEEKTLEFCTLAKRLLFEEKIAVGKGSVNKLGKVNEKVDSLRGLLFGNKMNHAGLCGDLFDLIDRMLPDLIRAHPANLPNLLSD